MNRLLRDMAAAALAVWLNDYTKKEHARMCNSCKLMESVYSLPDGPAKEDIKHGLAHLLAAAAAGRPEPGAELDVNFKWADGGVVTMIAGSGVTQRAAAVALMELAEDLANGKGELVDLDPQRKKASEGESNAKSDNGLDDLLALLAKSPVIKKAAEARAGANGRG